MGSKSVVAPRVVTKRNDTLFCTGTNQYCTGTVQYSNTGTVLVRLAGCGIATARAIADMSQVGFFGLPPILPRELDAMPRAQAPSGMEDLLLPACGNATWQRNGTAVAIATMHFGEDFDWERLQRLTVFTCNEPHHRGMIAGPLRTVPRQWATVGIQFDVLGEGDRAVAYVGDAVDERGASLAYPPVHMHHIHVHQSGGAVHWFETHGDYERGSEGYSHRLPTGFCSVHYGRKTLIEAQVNDVRFADGVGMAEQAAMSRRPEGVAARSAPPNVSAMTYYLRVAFRLAEASCTPVTKLFLFNPFTRFSSNDIYERYAVPNIEMVFWWSYRMPRSGLLLLPAWVHTHRARYGGLLLVEGNWSLATLASSRSGEFLCGSAADAVAHPMCRTAAAMRAHLMHRAAHRLLCHDDAAKSSYVQLPQAADGSGGYHDRPGAFTCREWHFRAGDDITAFSFAVPLWNPHVLIFPQHTMVFAHFVPAERASSEGLGTAESEFVKLWPGRYSAWKVGSSRCNENLATLGRVSYIVRGRQLRRRR